MVCPQRCKRYLCMPDYYPDFQHPLFYPKTDKMLLPIGRPPSVTHVSKLYICVPQNSKKLFHAPCAILISEFGKAVEGASSIIAYLQIYLYNTHRPIVAQIIFACNPLGRQTCLYPRTHPQISLQSPHVYSRRPYPQEKLLPINSPP